VAKKRTPAKPVKSVANVSIGGMSLTVNGRRRTAGPLSWQRVEYADGTADETITATIDPHDGTAVKRSLGQPTLDAVAALGRAAEERLAGRRRKGR